MNAPSIDIQKSIDDFLNKARKGVAPRLSRSFKMSGAYIPIRVPIRHKDGTIGTAVRWRSYANLGLSRIMSPKLPAVGSISQTPTFTKFSSVKQTLFVILDEADIHDVEENRNVPVYTYKFLGDGLYLYSDIGIAQKQAEQLKRDVFPAKISVNKVFNSTFDQIKLEDLSLIKEQGFDAIVLMRREPYEFDVFCFDSRNVMIIGHDAVSDTEEVRKSVEDYELLGDDIILSKEDLSGLECLPYENDEEVDIEKGVIRTPLKEDGSVDWDKVPKDGTTSIWITVTKPGPLEGRHILLTRRPDGLFAITGGAGTQHMKNKVSAFKHLVMEGRPKKTEADVKLDREIEEQLIAQQPIIEKRKELLQEARTETEAAARSFYDSIGIKKPDPNLIKKHRDELVEYAKEHGLDEDNAHSYATSIVRHGLRPIRERQKKEEQDRIKLFTKLRGFTDDKSIEDAVNEFNKSTEFTKLSVELPNPEQFKGKTPEEMESKISDAFDETVAEFMNPNPTDKLIDSELKAIGVELDDSDKKSHTLDLDANIAPLDIKNKVNLEESFTKYKHYIGIRNRVNELGKKIKRLDLTETTPSLLDQFRLEAKEVLRKEISDEEFEQITSSYDNQWQSNNSSLSFYKAVNEFWNDEKSIRSKINRTDNGFGGYVDSGANAAIAAITGKVLGERIDTSSLIDKTSIEAATMVVAQNLRDKLQKDPNGLKKYNSIIHSVEEYNSQNQEATEKRALERHESLKKRYATLQHAKETGLLVPKKEIGRDEVIGYVEGEVDNLIEQKRNLGTALGSMQASAALLNALYTVRDAHDSAISLNFGEDISGAKMRERELNLGPRASLDMSDPHSVKLITSSRALRRYAKSLEVIKDIHDENEKIKNDMSDTTYDEDGNLIVGSYKIPNWKDEYVDKDGVKHPYRSRVEQRNDIEFLGKMGNGLITRVTGSGKTNTLLGFFANKIAKDNTYSGLVVVPQGRTGQWMDESKMFSNLDTVLIPEGITKEERQKMLAKVKPGQVVIMNQKDATVSYYDLEAAFLTGALKGMVLDEPQEVASRSISGNMSAATRKLTKLPSENRIASTATPARDNLIEAYDLVNWVSHHDKRLGPRTRFQRVYSGYGSGTNAQDTALQQMIFREISPWMSGDKLTNPNFKVRRQEVTLKKSSKQDYNMRSISARTNDYIKSEKDKFIHEIESNPEKLQRMIQRHGRKGWKSVASKQAVSKAEKHILEEHENNLSGVLGNMTWADNPKINEVVTRLSKDRDKKHVLFVDNTKQRQAITEGLLSTGYVNKQIKNIASLSTSGRIKGEKMVKIAREFQRDPNARVIFIDRSSSSGYNLQEGDYLHVIGTPSDAATYLQAQGRLARMPRKGDVDIFTYKYDDVPFEDRKWTRLEQQIAILKATSPGLSIGEKYE
jgi:hypothetical protein